MQEFPDVTALSLVCFCLYQNKLTPSLVRMARPPTPNSNNPDIRYVYRAHNGKNRRRSSRQRSRVGSATLLPASREMAMGGKWRWVWSTSDTKCSDFYD